MTAVDRLSIVAHDRFQEIIDEANRPDSLIRLQQVILDPAADLQKMRANVLIYHQKQLAAFVHAQMQAHQWEKATGYEVKVNSLFRKSSG